MQNKIIVFFLLAFGVLLFVSCNDSPTDLGSGFLTQDDVQIFKFDSSVDSMNQTSNSFKHVYTLASSNIIMLGKAENVTSQILMKFVFAFPDSIKDDIINNNLIFHESWIEMHKDYSFGDSLSDLDYEVHKVNDFWTSAFSADSLPTLSYDNIDYSSSHAIEGDTLYTFRVDNSLILPWLENYSDTNLASNNGILLTPTASTQKILGFTGYNYDAINDPRLKIVFEKPGVYSDTITGYVSSDISLVLGDLPSVSSENIFIQSSLSGQVNLYFDLSVIPENTVINSATLILTVDSAETKTGSDYTNSLRVYLFSDSAAYEVNSNYVEVLSRSGDKFNGSVTDIIRAIHSGLDNQGLLIKASSDLNGVEIFALKGSNASDITKRPKLEIVYSRKK